MQKEPGASTTDTEARTIKRATTWLTDEKNLHTMSSPNPDARHTHQSDMPQPGGGHDASQAAVEETHAQVAMYPTQLVSRLKGTPNTTQIKSWTRAQCTCKIRPQTPC